MSVCTTLPNQNATLTFSGAQGQQVSLIVTNSTIDLAVVTLIRPDQTTQNLGTFTSPGRFFDAVTLPAAGTYTLVIDPQGGDTGCATFQMFTGADVYGGITPGGAPSQVCNATPGQDMNLVFSGTQGQRVSLQVTDASIALASVVLAWPSGTTQSLGTFSSTGRFFDTVTLPQTGTYTLQIDPQGTNTGCATFTLYDVPPDASATITPGGAPVQNLCNTVFGQDLALTFSGTQGQRVSLQVTDASIALASVVLAWPSGTTQSLGTFSSTGRFFDTVTLPQTGTYTLQIDPQGTNTGCATFTLYDVPPDASATITPGGAAVQACTTVHGQDILLTFSGTQGQVVTLQVASGGTLPISTVVLVWPSGTTQSLGTFSSTGRTFNPVTLPATGTYTLQIDPQGLGFGCATFTLGSA